VGRRTDPTAGEVERMATFVLIHGAGDVRWYWHLVEEELRTRGHDTVAPDLPCDDEIENDAAVGSPALHLDRLIEEGDTFVAVGHGEMTLKEAGRAPFVFTEVFTFKDDKIRRLETFHINLV
jgi:hypothetical protein